MQSSIKKSSKSKSVQVRRIEPGLYFSKSFIRVAIPFSADDPRVSKAFRQNKVISQGIHTNAGYDFWVVLFSNGVLFSIPFVTNTLPLEYWPDISQRGSDVEIPFEIYWVDADYHFVLKKKSGRFTPKGTEQLYELLELRMKEKISLDAAPNIEFQPA